MAHPLPVERPHSPTDTSDLRFDWLRAGIASGFIATFAMTICMAVAVAMTNSIGDTGGNRLERSFAALSSNELTRTVGDSFNVGMIANLVMGLAWAVVYARWAEPRLTGPGWRRGALFSLVPFALSVTVFFPIAGIGIFGIDSGAGVLPVLGNLILHLVYGITLGSLYAIEATSGSRSRQDVEANSNSERAAAFGVLAGGSVGFIAGWLANPVFEDLASRPASAIAGALTGAAIGMLMGSFFGLRLDEPGSREPPAR